MRQGISVQQEQRRSVTAMSQADACPGRVDVGKCESWHDFHDLSPIFGTGSVQVRVCHSFSMTCHSIGRHKPQKAKGQQEAHFRSCTQRRRRDTLTH
jgi:hypothetical protein